MAAEFALTAGALMGLAGSLHCAGLCGGIASSLLLATSTRHGASGRAAAVLTMQLGRAATYTLCGAIVGAAGAGFGLLTDLAGLQGVLRVLAAGTLVLTGLSVAGVGPGLAGLDRVAGRAFRAAGSLLPRGAPIVSPFLLGMIWGLAPCAMVYVALLNALLSGSALSGAVFMAGFGLATIPTVAATAYAATALIGAGMHVRNRQPLRRMLGATIAALGLASLAEPAMMFVGLCLGR